MYPSVYSIYTTYRYIDHIHTVHNTDLFLLYIAYTLYTGIYTTCTLSTALTCLSCIWHIHCSRYLFHALKNTANQRPGLPLHILRYATGNIPLLSCHSLRTTVYWGPFEDFSKASSETFQLLRTITNIPDQIRKSFPKISEHFGRFPKIFRKFKKIVKTSENYF